MRGWSGALVGMACVAVLAACTPEPGATGAAGADPAAASSAAAAPGTTPGGAPAGPGQAASVLRVIDGDTFRTVDGLEVRVLGIDACEAATPGGRRATTAARDLLVGADVTLIAEPGVDRDRYGRALRYVTANGRDVSEAMVTADHTAIYTKGRNDASPARQATLRRLDAGGRTCGDETAPAARPGVAVDVDRPATRRPAATAAPVRPAAKPAPRPAAKPAPRPAAKPAPRPAAKPAPRPAAKPAPCPSASYANCSAAKAAGAAPLRVGQPGYSTKLDRDGDGVACER